MKEREFNFLCDIFAACWVYVAPAIGGVILSIWGGGGGGFWGGGGGGGGVL